MDELSLTNCDMDQAKATCPSECSFSMQGFESDAHAIQFAECVCGYVREISRYMDLSQLDGVTIAHDYRHAVKNFDRGDESLLPHEASDGHAVGVAMTIPVVRDQVLKSHIILNAQHLLALEHTEHPDWDLAVHILAHECAHVEINQRFVAAFPDELFRKPGADYFRPHRWSIILSCWNEYAATSKSAPYGAKQTSTYEDNFLHSLAETKQKSNDLIIAYRSHGDIAQIVAEIYDAYGELLKFSAYHLGNMKGLGLSLDQLPRTSEALTGHWFTPFFEQLGVACECIDSEYGLWANQDAFEAIGDLADRLIAAGGLHIKTRADGQQWIDIPYSPDTMPSET